MRKKIQPQILWGAAPLILNSFATGLAADEKPLIDPAKVFSPDILNFLRATDEMLRECQDGTDDHRYSYREKSICSTKNNPNCTQKHVFETMLKEARFMSPADLPDANLPVTDGKIIKLKNSGDFSWLGNSFPYGLKSDDSISATVIKTGLPIFVNARAGTSLAMGAPQRSIDAAMKLLNIDTKLYSAEQKVKYMDAAVEINNAILFGPKNPTDFIYNNRIEVSVDRTTFSVTNHTMPSHILHDGYVKRTVMPPDAKGDIYVMTDGWGTGNKFGIAKCLNLKVYPTVWNHANEQLREAMKVRNAPVLVIDRSGSLTDQPGAMQQIQNKASEVVNAIQNTVGQAAVINFAGAGSAALDADFTADSATLLRAIESPSTAKGGTAIYSAIASAVSVASKKGQLSMLIVFTDGKNNQGSGLEQAVEYCKQNKVPVIVVGFTGTEGRDEIAMQQLADGTDGFYIPNESASVQSILKRFNDYSAAKGKAAPPLVMPF